MTDKFTLENIRKDYLKHFNFDIALTKAERNGLDMHPLAIKRRAEKAAKNQQAEKAPL